MDLTFFPVADHLVAALIWWANNPKQAIVPAALLAAVITTVAWVLTVQDNRRRDDELLDRLGSSTPGDPATELDAALLAARDTIEADPIPDLVDTNTAITVIRGAA